MFFLFFLFSFSVFFLFLSLSFFFLFYLECGVGICPGTRGGDVIHDTVATESQEAKQHKCTAKHNQNDLPTG